MTHRRRSYRRFPVRSQSQPFVLDLDLTIEDLLADLGAEWTTRLRRPPSRAIPSYRRG